MDNFTPDANNSDDGFIPDSQAGPSSEIGYKNMGAGIRQVSDAVRNTPGLNYVPQALGDIFELGRGTAGLLGNTKGYGRTENGQYIQTENPFRGPNVEAETRNQANPFGAIADVGKSALGAASTLYLPTKVPQLLGATGASKALAVTHPIMEFLARHGLSGLVTGTAAGIGTEKPTPGSVGATAAASAILEPILVLLSKGLTTKGVLKKMQDLTGPDTTKHSLADIKVEAQKSLEDHLGKKYVLHKREADQILDKLIKSMGETSGAGTDLSSSKLLEQQGELSKLSKGNFLQKLIGSIVNPNADLEPQVGEALRSTISNKLKEIPGMSLQNALYGLYKNPAIGSPAQLPLRAAGLSGILGTLGHLGVKL